MQPREWMMLALLIIVPLIIAVIVTLWSIKQIAYRPKKQAPPKPVLSAEELAGVGAGVAASAVPAADCAKPDDTGRCRH